QLISRVRAKIGDCGYGRCKRKTFRKWHAGGGLGGPEEISHAVRQTENIAAGEDAILRDSPQIHGRSALVAQNAPKPCCHSLINHQTPCLSIIAWQHETVCSYVGLTNLSLVKKACKGSRRAITIAKGRIATGAAVLGILDDEPLTAKLKAQLPANNKPQKD